MLSNQVPAEGEVQYDGTNVTAVAALAGEDRVTNDVGALQVKAANNKWLPVPVGARVVLFTKGDLSVMDNGEFERWYGTPAS